MLCQLHCSNLNVVVRPPHIYTSYIKFNLHNSRSKFFKKTSSRITLTWRQKIRTPNNPRVYVYSNVYLLSLDSHTGISYIYRGSCTREREYTGCRERENAIFTPFPTRLQTCLRAWIYNRLLSAPLGAILVYISLSFSLSEVKERKYVATPWVSEQ